MSEITDAGVLASLRGVDGANGGYGSSPTARGALKMIEDRDAEIARLTSALSVVGVQSQVRVALTELLADIDDPELIDISNATIARARQALASPRAEDGVTFCYVTYRACTARCPTRAECAAAAPVADPGRVLAESSASLEEKCAAFDEAMARIDAAPVADQREVKS